MNEDARAWRGWAVGWGGAWRLGRLAGIPVRIHWSFGLMLVWAALPALADPITWPVGLAYNLLLLAALIGCVVLHELGHGLVARRLGVRVRDITLLPIGGMARLEPAPGQYGPGDAATIALAGPAVNGGLALVLLPAAWVVSGAAQAGPAALLREWGHLSPAGFLTALWVGNLLLAGLNLLPLAPLDGGRALRAALGGRVGERAVRRLMAGLGLSLAVGVIMAGVWLDQPWLVGLAALVGLATGWQYAAGGA